MRILPSCVPCSHCNNVGLELKHEIINKVIYYHISCSIKNGGCSNRGESFETTEIAISEWNIQEDIGVVVGSSTKVTADKDRYNKPPLDLVPFSLTESAARAFAFGEKKYSRHNWRKGMPTSWIVRSLLSHVGRWNEGEDRDIESGLLHLDHIAACTAMLIETVAKHPIVDDRFKPEGSTPPCIAMRGATQHQNQGD